MHGHTYLVLALVHTHRSATFHDPARLVSAMPGVATTNDEANQTLTKPSAYALSTRTTK